MTTTTPERYEDYEDGAALLRPVATDAYGRAFDPALPCHLPGCHPAGAACYYAPAAMIRAAS